VVSFEQRLTDSAIPIYQNIFKLRRELSLLNTKEKPDVDNLLKICQSMEASLDNLGMGVFIISETDGCIVDANAVAATLCGKHLDQLIGCLWSSDTFTNRNGEDSIVHQNGKFIPVSTMVRKVQYNGISFTLIVCVELCAYRLLSQAVQPLTSFHPLTGLPQRNTLETQLERAMALAKNSGRSVAILRIDIDKMKSINDKYGYKDGDTLLKIVADRLSSRLRDSDTLVHLESDEFILACQVQNETDVDILAKKFLKIIAEPASLSRESVVVSASIGVSLFPVDGWVVQDLLRRSEDALNHAKEARNNYVLYSSSINAADAIEILLGGDLPKALPGNELILHYQPQIDCQTGRIIGAEALLRWQHPERGLVPPSQFIPLAESSGLINEFGTWVLQQACVQIAKWEKLGCPPIQVAVNASVCQMQDPAFPAQVATIVRKAGIRPEHLEIELTETVLMKQTLICKKNIRELQALGVSVALDDFGTGFSSLKYLKDFDFNRLKIDRYFIHELASDLKARDLLTGIFSLARRLDLRVVAEGIENKEQYRILTQMGCRYMQGFMFGRPVPADELTMKLQQTVQTEFFPQTFAHNPEA